MDYIQRKVFLTKYLVPYDSDGDGIMDALVLSATTKTLQVPLRQSFDDIGIYDIDSQESIEIIDIGGFLDDSISGDDVTQPDEDITVPTNTWDSGGSTSTEQQEVFYCNDSTASNYEELVSETVNGIVVWKLIATDGSEKVYYANANGQYPIFTNDPTRCSFSTTVDDNPSIGSGGSSSSSGSAGILTQTKLSSYCGQSWSDYLPTALSNANSYCLTNYGSSTILSSDLPGGYGSYDCYDEGVGVFAGVKYKTHTSSSCCTSYTCGADGDECCPNYRRTFTYCFYCK